ncbi:MAG: AbrB/MazE/SpoVT family DNA-binding domain-containing protein [Defluviitaleaceae bacterium]|nr:AbrB/MazE/SpoVT family DNA-binding domain-containing protein [Defluviitaleaceae bacterium]
MKTEKLNELGLIKLPTERLEFGYSAGTNVELYIESDKIILTKTEKSVNFEDKNCSVCQIDELGRVHIKSEIREKLFFQNGDHIQFEINEDRIIMAKCDA